MKILKKAELVSENEFTKIFKYNEVEVFLSKAVDEEINKHYMVASIPSIPELQVTHLKYPFVYDTSKQRDEEFNGFDIYSASELVEYLIDFIKTQQQKQRDENIS